MEKKIVNDTKIVTDVRMARRLLRLGNTIVDIKPRHGNPEATVFVFKNNSKLNEDIKNMISSFNS